MNKALRRSVAAALVAAVTLVGFAGAAGAIDDDPPGTGEPPPPPTARPNLVISTASVTPLGTSQWQISYTVRNSGTASSTNFRVAIQNNATTTLKETYHVGLAAGASRSETFAVARTACYVPVSVTADSTKVVGESSEVDNARWAIGLTDPACTSLPKYTLKATSFKAVDETGSDWAGSDEPYFVFNATSNSGVVSSSDSQIFGDVDTGETRTFSSTEGCLGPRGCAATTAPYGLGVSVQGFEHDYGDPDAKLAVLADFFHQAGSWATDQGLSPWLDKALELIADAIDFVNSWADDEFIGTHTTAYSLTNLASRLRSVGAVSTDTLTLSSSAGRYTVTVQLTRVA